MRINFCGLAKPRTLKRILRNVIENFLLVFVFGISIFGGILISRKISWVGSILLVALIFYVFCRIAALISKRIRHWE